MQHICFYLMHTVIAAEFYHTKLCAVSAVLLLAINDEQIKTAVMYGNRLPLNEVTRHAGCLRNCIDQCWRESPDERPSFDGK